MCLYGLQGNSAVACAGCLWATEGTLKVQTEAQTKKARLLSGQPEAQEKAN